ncbi:hypothetical protein ABVK26_09065 [Mycobacterium kansasii]
MRIAMLVAVPLLVAGCSHDIDGRPGLSPTSTPTSIATSSAPSASGKPPAGSAASSAPAAGAPISAVIAWIEAGRPADPTRYHSVSRDDVTAELGDDIAFTAQSGKASCLTDSKHTGSALVTSR